MSARWTESKLLGFSPFLLYPASNVIERLDRLVMDRGCELTSKICGFHQPGIKTQLKEAEEQQHFYRKRDRGNSWKLEAQGVHRGDS